MIIMIKKNYRNNANNNNHNHSSINNSNFDDATHIDSNRK